jgi:hypothetical protein
MARTPITRDATPQWTVPLCTGNSEQHHTSGISRPGPSQKAAAAAAAAVAAAKKVCTARSAAAAAGKGGVQRRHPSPV